MRVQGMTSGDFPSSSQMARDLKNDRERMKALDRNKDGQIDMEEWEAGLAEYKKFLMEKNQVQAQGKTGETSQEMEFSGMVTGSEEVDLVFARSEKEFVGRLGLFAVLGILGGGSAFILGLILLIQRLV